MPFPTQHFTSSVSDFYEPASGTFSASVSENADGSLSGTWSASASTGRTPSW